MTLFATPYYLAFNDRKQILISDCDANSVKVGFKVGVQVK